MTANRKPRSSTIDPECKHSIPNHIPLSETINNHATRIYLRLQSWCNATTSTLGIPSWIRQGPCSSLMYVLFAIQWAIVRQSLIPPNRHDRMYTRTTNHATKGSTTGKTHAIVRRGAGGGSQHVAALRR